MIPLTKRIMDCSKLNETFNCDGPEWLDVDDTPVGRGYWGGFEGRKHTEETKRKIRLSLIGTKEDPEHKKWRANLISEGFKNKENIAEWADTKITTNTQRIEVVVEGIKFRSRNEAARWAMKKYNIGRNTAIHYIKEGRSFTDKKYKNLKYKGFYTGAKYT
tara:strand:- start:57 stop:539 length:483 start_codon:yes stop_codon:yes gene_type:complete